MLSPLPRAGVLAAIAFAAAPTHVAAQELRGPPAEVRPGPQLAVPAVPSFVLPPEEPGFRSVRELRVRGRHSWLGTEITVKGYVTWIYDCAKAIRQPGETPAQTQRRIDDDQTRCERPKFYLGATKDAPPERSIWVVSVPRHPTKTERRFIKPAELAKWPPVPKFALGDHVAVTGTWALQSPHGDRNSDGLLVFKALQPASPSPAAPARTAPPAPPKVAVKAPPKLPPAPPPRPVDRAKRQQSIKQTNEGARALGRGDVDAALREYKAAVATWPDNHSAWYYLSYAHTRKAEWSEAAAAVAEATRLAPDQVMYRMLRGLCLYELAVRRARERQAAAQGKKPEEVTPDLRAVNQDAALAELELAIHLNKELWRAHYYRGRIFRDRGDDATAAEAFTQAVRGAPPQAAPYVALAELYRRWDYFDQAIAVARLGIGVLQGTDERGDVLYMLGLAHEDKREDATAIDAYTKAFEARPDLALALFQRGQLFFRMNKHAAAKIDLEAYLAHPRASGFAKAQAARMLMDLAAKKP